jgi:hypothetical protein
MVSKHNMKRNVLPWAIAIPLAFILGCNTSHGRRSSPVLDQTIGTSPFSISVVPTRSGPSGRGISMATNTLDDFYVILTNVSKEPQSAFRTSNSWGYYALSFEMQMPDGRIVVITKKPVGFTRNMPSIFVIPPGEQMVFPVRLGNEWEAVPPLPKANLSLAVKIKAIYEVKPTPESAEQKVWTGRAESRGYRFDFWHWLEHASAD